MNAHRKIISFSIVLTIALAIIPLNGFSESMFSDGSKIEIQWYEKEGLILVKYVCFNYEKDEKKYRECREKAEDYFEDECEFYESKMKNTPQKYRSMYEPELKKFCTASEKYRP